MYNQRAFEYTVHLTKMLRIPLHLILLSFMLLVLLRSDEFVRVKLGHSLARRLDDAERVHLCLDTLVTYRHGLSVEIERPAALILCRFEMVRLPRPRKTANCISLHMTKSKLALRH